MTTMHSAIALLLQVTGWVGFCFSFRGLLRHSTTLCFTELVGGV